VDAEITTFFSSFENYKRLKKRVAGPIPDVEKYFLKEPTSFIAPERGNLRALTHIPKRG
jgi:hypothetical protein